MKNGIILYENNKKKQFLDWFDLEIWMELIAYMLAVLFVVNKCEHLIECVYEHWMSKQIMFITTTTHRFNGFFEGTYNIASMKFIFKKKILYWCEVHHIWRLYTMV